MSLAAAPAAARACLSVVEGHRKVYFNDLQLAAQAVTILFGQGPVLGMPNDEDSMVSSISKRILEAAAVHFHRDFKGLRDVIHFLRKTVRAPPALIKSLERLNSAHGFVKHMTAFSCDCILAQMLLLPPVPCAPEAGPYGQAGEGDMPVPMDPEADQVEAPTDLAARQGAPRPEGAPLQSPLLGAAPGEGDSRDASALSPQSVLPMPTHTVPLVAAGTVSFPRTVGEQEELVCNLHEVPMDTVISPMDAEDSAASHGLLPHGLLEIGKMPLDALSVPMYAMHVAAERGLGTGKRRLGPWRNLGPPQGLRSVPPLRCPCLFLLIRLPRMHLSPHLTVFCRGVVCRATQWWPRAWSGCAHGAKAHSS